MTIAIISLFCLIVIPIVLIQVEKTSSKNSTPQTETKIPKTYQQALTQAKNYATVLHMSKQDITDQLNSGANEKYSSKAIDYAMKNLKVNFNKNALKKAQEYSDSQNMSQAGIYNQLINKGKFTPHQAQYAIDNLHVDYNQNALITAKNYQTDLGFSKATIRQVLISDKNEGFTPEQADYAIQHLDD